MAFEKPHRPFEVKEYDPIWSEMFEIRNKKIKEILGDLVVEIHHIGSTSIPNMPAKPQIDILVVVSDLNAVKDKYQEMELANFNPRGNYTGIGEEYFTEDDGNGARISSIHILPIGHPEIEDILAFRKYLLENSDDREKYITKKRELFEKYSQDYQSYDSGKKATIEEIRAKIKK